MSSSTGRDIDVKSKSSSCQTGTNKFVVNKITFHNEDQPCWDVVDYLQQTAKTDGKFTKYSFWRELENIIYKARHNGLFFCSYTSTGEFAGFLIGQLNEFEKCSLDYLCVVQKYRRQGVGTLLVDNAEKQMKSELCTCVDLEALPGSKEFWIARGYKNYTNNVWIKIFDEKSMMEKAKRDQLMHVADGTDPSCLT